MTLLLEQQLTAPAQTLDVTNIYNFGSIAFQLEGTWTGTVSFSGSVDGTVFEPISLLNLSSLLASETATVNGVFVTNASAYQAIRVTSTALSSGTVDVFARGQPSAYVDAGPKLLRGASDNSLIGNIGPNLSVTDRPNSGGVNGAISVGTSAVEAKVGASVLADRKVVHVFNDGSQEIYWGYSSSVTTSNGTPVFKRQLVTFEVEKDVEIWLIAASGTQDVRIGELA